MEIRSNKKRDTTSTLSVHVHYQRIIGSLFPEIASDRGAVEERGIPARYQPPLHPKILGNATVAFSLWISADMARIRYVSADTSES